MSDRKKEILISLMRDEFVPLIEEHYEQLTVTQTNLIFRSMLAAMQPFTKDHVNIITKVLLFILDQAKERATNLELFGLLDISLDNSARQIAILTKENKLEDAANVLIVEPQTTIFKTLCKNLIL